MAAVLRAAASRSRLRPTDITTRQHVLAWAAVPSHNSQPANPKGAAMTSLRRDPEERQRASSAARTTARRSALNLARDAGAQVISRPIFPGAHTTTGDVEPLAGLQASRDIELGARHIARGYIRDAREAGHGWQAIGIALDLTPDADRAGQSIAEAGYTYAAGDPDTSTMSTAMPQAACGSPPPKLPGTPDGKPSNDPRPPGDGAPRDRWHRRSRQADHRAGLRGPEHQPPHVLRMARQGQGSAVHPPAQRRPAHPPLGIPAVAQRT